MRLIPAIFLMLIVMTGAVFAQTENPLAVFEPLMGTWTGESTDHEDSSADVMHVEWILGGAAVQHTHSLNGGEYGGRTIYFWDAAANAGAGAIIYHYFTTAGFHTQGSAQWEGGTFEATEAVEGHPTITQVRSIAEPDGEGGWLSHSSYLDDGEWVDGHGFHYRPTPDAELVFGQD